MRLPNAASRTWIEYAHGEWSHRPWFKVAINTLLRALQTRRRPADLFVMFTRTDERTRPPTVVGYGFGRVTHH